MTMDIEQGDLTPILDKIASYPGDAFYNFVKKFVGEVESEIFEIQHIKNVRILLQIPDVLSFLQLNCKNTFDLKQKACFISNDMQAVVRPGVKSNIERFIYLLKNHYASKSTDSNYAACEKLFNESKQTHQCVCDLVIFNRQHDEYESQSFAKMFISNLLKNMERSNNNYEFDPHVSKFASVFNILAGNNAYEFVRKNLPGALPSITTLKNYNQTINNKLSECKFRFDSLKIYLDSIESQHVFVSEDSTSVISSVSYDAIEDCFIGFTPPLNDGLPSVNRFRTNSFTELEDWFQNLDRSTLVTAVLIEPLLTNTNSSVHSRPYILSAYGTNNKYSAVDVLRKWIHIYNELKKRKINVIGFSSDCDSRYLKSMQIALDFFARAPNIDLLTGYDKLFNIDIPKHWSFFFMKSTQLFLCMQDSIHLVTKIRNRLLSETATLLINDEQIDMNHLLYIIENHTKIEHNLVKSDIFPHDRQNYHSCLKITSDDVINLLKQQDHKATYIYLFLLKLIILAYVKSDTDILPRLYYGWVVVSAYRIWWTSIYVNRNMSESQKENSFITKHAWLSSEINIHSLTSLIILVSQGHLPPARSLTGTFSTISTFSVSQFMNKIDKISILNQIKSMEESSNKTNSLKFPVHHKNRRNESICSTKTQYISSITIDNIEEIIMKAYRRAESIMNCLNLTEMLKKNKVDDLSKLSSCVFRKLNEKSTIDYTIINSYDAYDSFDDNDDNHIADESGQIDPNNFDEDSEEDHHEEYHLTTTKQIFEGMSVYEKISPSKVKNYFEIFINNKLHYMHKQTAARLLTMNKNRLSSDRLLRVQQASKQQ